MYVFSFFLVAPLLLHEGLRNAVMPNHQFFKTSNSTYHDDSSINVNNNTKRKIISISYVIRPTKSNTSSTPLLDYAQESFNCDLGIMNPAYCRKNASQIMYRSPLTEKMASLTTDFTTSISTNLNVLVLGDSLGVQFYNMLVAGMGFSPAQDKEVFQSFQCFTEQKHVALALTTSKNKTKNRLATWRIYGFLTHRNENETLPSCMTEGIGWTREQAAQLRGETNETYDTMFFRIPYGHLALSDITKQDLWETLRLAHELMGVRTVIIATLPLINNVSPELEPTWEAKNEELRTWIYEYETGSIPGIDAIVYIDFAQLMNEMVWENARLLYHNRTKRITNGTSRSSSIDDVSWLERLSCESIVWRWNYAIQAQMCSSLPKAPEKCVCPGNSISKDGMHFCPRTFASRFLAGIGCLWKCMYSSTSLRRKMKLQQCQNECNAKFMTLRPLEVSNYRKRL